MISTIESYWNKIGKIGSRYAIYFIDKRNLTIVNHVSFVFAIIFTVLTLEDFRRKEYLEVVFDSIYILLLIIPIFLNYNGRYRLSFFVYCICYPLIYSVLLLFYGNIVNGSYLYLLMIVITIIFYYRHPIYTNIIISIDILLWVLVSYFNDNYAPLMTYNPSPLDPYFCPCAVTIGLIILMMTFRDEVLKKETELTIALQNVEKQNEALNVANAELERFAYIASHDLKTPLRTIVSFLNIIERKIDKNELDDLKTYITYAKEAACK